jgi:hypothetical protein
VCGSQHNRRKNDYVFWRQNIAHFYPPTLIISDMSMISITWH